MSQRMSIRVRLALPLALGLTPILVLGALQATSSFRRDAAERRQNLVLAAQRSAVGARIRMEGAVGLLETLTPQTAGLDCSQRLADRLAHLRGYANLIRFNATGRVQCAAADVAPDPGRRTAAWFQALQHGAPLVVARDATARDPSLVMAVRVVGERGSFQGALAAILPLSSFRPDLHDPTLPAHTEVALADRAGALILQTDPGELAAPPKGWEQEAVRDGAAFYHARDAAGRWRTHVGAPLVEDAVFVVLSAPEPTLWSWARLNPIATLVLPILAWLTAWAVVWIVTDRVVIRWLAYLERIAGLYAKGRFSVRAVQARDAPSEIRTLAQTMDAMADAIVARDQSLRDSLGQKDALMREIHHRVKNNLQVITSLLNMQQRALTDPAARAAMTDTRQRITALALIYRALYQSPDLRRVDVRQFLEELLGQLLAGEGGRPSPVRTELDADDLEIDPDKLAPLALFAVEAITAARKHAATGGGLIHVAFRVGPEVVLEISDNGEGPAAEELGAAGVGRTLMTAFARQLRGRLEIEPVAGGAGVVTRLTFPRPEVEEEEPLRHPFGNQAAA
ncbi:MAG: sensor histidine kinase [Caulobacteraceae bacterium]|nr:sensor histidine kinase [Caulobacter sp.]